MRPCRSECRGGVIRVEQNQAANHPDCMNETETEIAVTEMPLAESHHELELLLEALNALNDALDRCEAGKLAERC